MRKASLVFRTLGTGLIQEDFARPVAEALAGPVLAWAVSRAIAERESALLRQAARFAAAPLAALSWRATLAALLKAYVGRRGAAQAMAGRSRRETGETIRAVLLIGDLADTGSRDRDKTVADVIGTIEADETIERHLRHELCSALRTLCRALGKDPLFVTADPAALRRRGLAVRPAC